MTKLGVSGHQDIPQGAIHSIRADIRKELRSIQLPFFGFTSLAAGADQMFSELVLECLGELCVVVPCANYEDTFQETATLKNYQTLLAKASKCITLPYDNPSDEAFWIAGRTIVDLSDRLIAIWDGERSKGRGGTADVVAYAKAGSKPISIIWPVGLRR